MGPPQLPADNPPMDDLRSRFGTISVHEPRPTPDLLTRSTGSKRKTSDDDDFANLKRLKRERRALMREKWEYKEKINKLKTYMSMMEARESRKKDEMEALLKGKSAEELMAWHLATGSSDEEEVGRGGTVQMMQI